MPRRLRLFQPESQSSGIPETGTATIGSPIYLRDVATVSWGTADKTLVISDNGKPGMALNIFRQPNSDVVAVSKSVAQALPALEKQLPAASKSQRPMMNHIWLLMPFKTSEIRSSQALSS